MAQLNLVRHLGGDPEWLRSQGFILYWDEKGTTAKGTTGTGDLLLMMVDLANCERDWEGWRYKVGRYSTAEMEAASAGIWRDVVRAVERAHEEKRKINSAMVDAVCGL